LDIDIDSNGQSWFATPSAGLVTDLGNGGPWQRWNMSNSPIPTNGLTCVAINADDQRIFMGTELFGIIIKKGDVWFTYNQENIGLPEDHITAIAHESSSVKWIGTFNHGVVRLEENSVSINTILNSKLNVYPTMVSSGEFITIIPVTMSQSITLIDQLGHEISIEQMDGKFQLPTQINPGIYMLNLSKNSFYPLIKIIIL